ncbi:MAG: hypothetical protein Faunusvirus2_51 [Faunusvirus sp.]|uniref:Uncharacterized protein n=1 Tax=Faunusvirus sp. TaxID=2487766 RepID=A0A3G4ZXN9_9VIRU|nr:MAG: hypothetical protein Faunusvirus2_51 [Faunusvirus sp.]
MTATALIHAGRFITLTCSENSTKCIEYINRYDDFYNISIAGWTPLMYSICEHIDVMAILIQKGVNVNYKSQGGINTLTLACIHGYEDKAIMLIKAGIDFVDLIDTHIVKFGYQQVMLCIRNVYQQCITSTINDDDACDNAIATSFKTTYVSGIINMIGEFII